MAKNTSLGQAKKAKKDEFYTQLSDIENEVMHYKEHFKGKTVLCNCDDPKVSNFFVFFVRNFKEFGLKRLITTCYKNSQYDLFSQHDEEHAVMLDYRGGDDNNPDVKKIAATAVPLKGDGDFRSGECIELLKEADIVVTNPPFSLFREYVAQLIKYEKKFLIIGNQNAIHYAEIFPFIRNNQIWLGYGFQAGNAFFSTPDVQNYSAGVYNPETGLVKFRNCHWFTNLEHQKRHETLDLYKTYNEDDYPKYDNYDAIEVGKVADIPMNYYGVMGVPDTFLGSYNPEQFEILGVTQRGCHDLVPDTKKYNDYWEMKQNGQKTGSSGNKTNENANLSKNDGKHNYFINKEGHIVQSCYSRIFIKLKRADIL